MYDKNDNRKVLVAIDISEDKIARKLLSYALKINHPEGEIQVVNVMDVNLNSPMIDRFADMKKSYAESTQRGIQRLLAETLPETARFSVSVKSGRAYAEILQVAKDMEADMIIIGAYRPVMKDFLLGNTAAKVVRHAKCSVTVIR